MNENKIGLKINGDKVNVRIAEHIFENSLLYSLLFSSNPEVNINSEIERIKNDIHVLEGFIKLNENLSEVILEIRNSNSDESINNLVKKFHVSQIQASSFVDMELNDIGKIDYQKLINNLNSSINFLQNLQF
jgi:phosphoribosylaminoimidazole carboxylase (NCAIR synthetase)